MTYFWNVCLGATSRVQFGFKWANQSSGQLMSSALSPLCKREEINKKELRVNCIFKPWNINPKIVGPCWLKRNIFLMQAGFRACFNVFGWRGVWTLQWCERSVWRSCITYWITHHSHHSHCSRMCVQSMSVWLTLRRLLCVTSRLHVCCWLHVSSLPSPPSPSPHQLTKHRDHIHKRSCSCSRN